MNELLEQVEKWLQEAQEEADETIYDFEERFHLGEVEALTRVFALVRVLASQQKMDRRKIMKQWDSWRKYIAEGGGGSWPTDAFESLLDSYDEKIKSLEHLIRTLRRNS